MNPKEELSQIGRYFAQKSWSLATSSNYSTRTGDSDILITRSGFDKFQMTTDDVIEVDRHGRPRAPATKASAETLIHTAIYDEVSWARCVLHTHSVFGTRLSLLFEGEGQIGLQGYEMLKGLRGNQTHDMTEIIPVLPNSQDMVEFSKKLRPLLKGSPRLHGFLIAGHGLYTWGESIAEAKRHVETLEFLFECLAYEKLGL